MAAEKMLKLSSKMQKATMTPVNFSFHDELPLPVDVSPLCTPKKKSKKKMKKNLAVDPLEQTYPEIELEVLEKKNEN